VEEVVQSTKTAIIPYYRCLRNQPSSHKHYGSTASQCKSLTVSCVDSETMEIKCKVCSLPSLKTKIYLDEEDYSFRDLHYRWAPTRQTTQRQPLWGGSRRQCKVIKQDWLQEARAWRYLIRNYTLQFFGPCCQIKILRPRLLDDMKRVTYSVGGDNVIRLKTTINFFDARLVFGDLITYEFIRKRNTKVGEKQLLWLRMRLSTPLFRRQSTTWCVYAFATTDSGIDLSYNKLGAELTVD
jgi:hypothetical protein